MIFFIQNEVAMHFTFGFDLLIPSDGTKPIQNPLLADMGVGQMLCCHFYF